MTPVIHTPSVSPGCSLQTFVQQRASAAPLRYGRRDSATLIITAISIGSVSFLEAFLQQPFLRRPDLPLGCEWHINSILRSVVRELVFHRVILTLWV